jgi:branched-chain amino acid transport system permease protein
MGEVIMPEFTGRVPKCRGVAAGVVRVLDAVGLSPLSALIFVGLGVGAPFVGNEFILRLMVSSLMFGGLAMGFDFTAGFINIVNFGYAALWGLGGYTSALLTLRCTLSPWLGFLFGGLAAAVVGFVVGALTLRLRGIFAAVMAWFVGLVLMALATQLVDLTRGQLGLNVPLLFDTARALPYFYVVLIMTVVTFCVFRLITRSHVGLAFRAIGQDIAAAQASGINPTRYKVLNFTVSSGIAGVFGAFYAHFVGILTPDVMHTKHTVEVLAMAYVGGRGSIWGGLAAAFLLIPVFEYLRYLMELRHIIYGMLLVLVMVFYPGGVSAAVRQIEKRWKGGGAGRVQCVNSGGAVTQETAGGPSSGCTSGGRGDGRCAGLSGRNC